MVVVSMEGCSRGLTEADGVGVPTAVEGAGPPVATAAAGLLGALGVFIHKRNRLRLWSCVGRISLW
jgi:hypothetical protein